MTDKEVRLLKLATQEAVMVTLVSSPAEKEWIVVENPCLVFAEQDPNTGGTKISYVPWVPFYASQEQVKINKDTIVTGLYEQVNKELMDRYLEMISPASKILMPNKKLIV